MTRKSLEIGSGMFIMVLLLFGTGTMSHAQPGASAVIVTARKMSGRQPKYAVDSKPVADLLAALNNVQKQRGPDQMLNVIVDQRLPCEEIFTITGVAAKAGLIHARVFIASFEHLKMVEIKRTPPVPLDVR